MVTERIYVEEPTGNRQCLDSAVDRQQKMNGSSTWARVENFEMDTDGAVQAHEEINHTGKWSIMHMLSKVYAEFLIIIAATSVFTEILHGPIHLFQIHVYFYFFLLVMSIIIFVLGFTSKHLQKHCSKEVHLKLESETLYENDCCHYNHYFRFGIIVCGLAAFVCASLKSAAVFMAPEPCVNAFISSLLILHCVFIVLQPGFLLLNVNRLYSTFGCFYKIALMHLVATNAALWFKIVLWESSKDWQAAVHLKHNSSLKWGQRELNITLHSVESDIDSDNPVHHFPKHAVHVTSNCWWRVPEAEISEDILSIQLCIQNSSVGCIWRTSSDSLYPVIMQYYIIIIVMLCIMWDRTNFKPQMQYVSNFIEHFQNTGFCFNSVKGFSLGTIFSVISLAVVFGYGVLGHGDFNFINRIILCLIFSVAACASIICLVKLRHVPVSTKPLNQDLFHSYQQIGLIFVSVYGILNITASTFLDDMYTFLISVEAFLMILHSICQYILITRILTSYVYFQTRIKCKQAISFLVMCNITLWILESFMFWKYMDVYPQLKIYGSLVWPIIIRIITPCLVFYRFNSAIILLEMLKFCHVESQNGGF